MNVVVVFNPSNGKHKQKQTKSVNVLKTITKHESSVHIQKSVSQEGFYLVMISCSVADRALKFNYELICSTAL